MPEQARGGGGKLSPTVTGALSPRKSYVDVLKKLRGGILGFPFLGYLLRMTRLMPSKAAIKTSRT
jgi:hypothetical protein